MSETELVRAIITALQVRGVLCWRNNSGMLRGSHKGKDWAVKLSPAGSPDILLMVPKGPERGVLAGLECKVGTNKQTPLQKAWQGRMERAGGYYSVARSVSEALRAVELWSGGAE